MCQNHVTATYRRVKFGAAMQAQMGSIKTQGIHASTGFSKITSQFNSEKGPKINYIHYNSICCFHWHTTSSLKGQTKEHGASAFENKKFTGMI
jgi:hypothetical protein